MEWIGIVLTNQKSKLTACVYVVVVMQGCVDVDVRICGVVFVIDLQPVFREYNNPEMNQMLVMRILLVNIFNCLISTKHDTCSCHACSIK